MVGVLYRRNRSHCDHWHLYQGLYKSFPIQQDDHYLTVCRYVERNALRAGLVKRAEDWAWTSPSVWQLPDAKVESDQRPRLSDWPVDRPRQWLRAVNVPQTRAEEEALRRAVNRGRPFGTPTWEKQTATWLSLESTMRTAADHVRKRSDDLTHLRLFLMAHFDLASALAGWRHATGCIPDFRGSQSLAYSATT